MSPPEHGEHGFEQFQRLNLRLDRWTSSSAAKINNPFELKDSEKPSRVCHPARSIYSLEDIEKSLKMCTLMYLPQSPGESKYDAQVKIQLQQQDRQRPFRSRVNRDMDTDP